VTAVSSPEPLPDHLSETAEGRRLANAETAGWRRWGPYLSERQWGTVREDYSADGEAWTYFPHEQARSRAYRWGEDGLAGFGDEQLRWCLALALWNEQDPILKERLFGLTNAEGNHGEDVKELYFYLDGTPTHSYMRMLYRYPQRAFPYDELVHENAARGTDQPEYELLDTGVMAEDRFFDVTVEYAKAAPDDVMMRVRVRNCGPDAAPLHVLPMLWARNTWSWSDGEPRPSLTLRDGGVDARHPEMAPMRLDREGDAAWLFCENETNDLRLFGVAARYPGPFKDGFNDAVVHGDATAVRPGHGTRCAAHTRLLVPAGGEAILRLRLRPLADPAPSDFADFDVLVATRRAEADAFYAVLQRDIADADARLVQRQALGGMLWSKQFYHLDVRRWLDGDPTQPQPPPARRLVRNFDWPHLTNADIISMPDKWEYPWYAAWDLAFHCVTFALIDTAFAKNQLVLLARAWYMHPNGQLPAYEWAFDDVNPPVHAWAAWRVYEMDRIATGRGDRAFLERVFHKLLLNFTWWVNRKDAQGRNLFQGGFLGLDNIGLFDRSKPLPTGGTMDQSDGTAWMAMFTLNLLRIALELAQENPVYQDVATKFFEHFLYIADAMGHLGSSGTGLWNEGDGFFYDVLNLPEESGGSQSGGHEIPLRVRSMVGLLRDMPLFAERLEWFLRRRPDLTKLISRWEDAGAGSRNLLSLLRGHRMKCLLAHMLDETEFLSPFGIRALSRYYADSPYVFEHDGQRFTIAYEPAESDSRLFGGNSNWRGPIWLPVNFLLVEALREFHLYYGEDFLVECPTRSGQKMTLDAIADMLARRLASLSLQGSDGTRPVMATYPGLAPNPDGEALLLFHEYYHGDTGRGVGASHQTGWSGLVALLLQPRGTGRGGATRDDAIPL
jgi:hypothetical protein